MVTPRVTRLSGDPPDAVPLHETTKFYRGTSLVPCGPEGLESEGGEATGSFETTGDQTAEPDKVLLESVRRFKGLERPVIVLTGIDDLPLAEEQALLYVGLSRARVHLVIVATEATMERVGGGGGGGPVRVGRL